MNGENENIMSAAKPRADEPGSTPEPSSLPDEAALPSLARAAVETYVRDGRLLEPESAPPSSLLRERAACFVTIKTAERELRGCIGTVEPAKATLAEEIIANAVSSATRDPRFHPVAEDELAALRYSVDVLLPPEPARFEDLDPSVFGVIVEDETGSRRGLLLPAIEGVGTAREQVEIAARKAGIRPGTPLRFFRFRVRRFRELVGRDQLPNKEQTDE